MSVATVGLPTIRAAWDEAAREDAVGNIITVPGITREEFFERGRREIAGVLDHLDALGLRQREQLALDFGCGIGRLTVALASEYDRVIGVDVSREMVRRAEPHGRVRYMRTDTLRIFVAATFDLIYSNITLQHMPSELQEGYVRDFVRLLARSGAAVFEIPDGVSPTPDYSCQSMYATPRTLVEDWVTDEGGRIVEIESTGMSPGATSQRYIVAKGRA